MPQTSSLFPKLFLVGVVILNVVFAVFAFDIWR